MDRENGGPLPFSSWVFTPEISLNLHSLPPLGQSRDFPITGHATLPRLPLRFTLVLPDAELHFFWIYHSAEGEDWIIPEERWMRVWDDWGENEGEEGKPPTGEEKDPMYDEGEATPWKRPPRRCPSSPPLGPGGTHCRALYGVDSDTILKDLPREIAQIVLH